MSDKIRVYPKIPKDRKVAKDYQKLLNYIWQENLKENMPTETSRLDNMPIKQENLGL